MPEADYAIGVQMQPEQPAKKLHGGEEAVAAYPDTDGQFGSGNVLPDYTEFYTRDPVTGQYVYNFPWAYWAYVTGQAPTAMMAAPPPPPPPPPAMEDSDEEDEVRVVRDVQERLMRYVQQKQSELQEILRQQAALFRDGEDDTGESGPAPADSAAPASEETDKSSKKRKADE